MYPLEYHYLKKRVGLKSYFLKATVFLTGIFISVSLSAQLGPGGVSHETPSSANPTQSDVRLWLDAGYLTNLADGDPVEEWNDISHSAINDRGYREASDNFLPPYFRDDPSASINGYPVVTFEDGRMLKVASSNDLNTSIQTTYEQTIILAFRTSEDVTSRQILWEEGGGWRGMNIFIFNGEIHLGAYDKEPDNDVGNPNVAPFGYSYVKTPIQPNTTYVLSHIFWAPTDNSLNGWVRGYQNGSFFGTLLSGGQYNAGVGGVFRHPDPIGIGAVNSDSFNETGPVSNQTGTQAFKGRLAEICYYNRLLNDAERIIVENYLGAKYYANIIVNDRYEHQAGFGKDVMGIGQTSNSNTTRHTVSQGRNPFELSAVNESVSFNAANEFLLVGNNGLPMTYTDINVPNDPGSTMRTERIWRFDESGELATVRLRFKNTNLPSLPAGFTKHVLIFDNSGGNFPNFSNTNALVYEMQDMGNGYSEVRLNVQDNAFMTMGALKPQISFKTTDVFALESDPSPDSTAHFTKIYARLNFVPTSIVRADFNFSDQTAARSTDYGYLNSDVNNGLTFPPGLQEVPIRVWIKNDVIQENPGTENFLVNLYQGPNTTAGLGIGTISQLTFTIYDNDPPPKLSFAQVSAPALENAGAHVVNVVRTGSTSGTASARVRVVAAGTNANLNEDYTYPAYKTVSFTAGQSVSSVTIDITDDLIDEHNENIRLQLYNIINAGTETSSILLHDVEIVDNDLPPTVGFTSTTSQNYETNGTPLIMIELDQISAKDVSVSYTMTENLSTAASFGSDYNLTFPATVVIPAGDTLGLPVNFIVQQDGVAEDDETVEFLLTGAVNASLGTNTSHVYTIKDYSAFEWKGVAGVGKDSDNIFWLDINRQSGAHNSALQTITNFSPHNINTSQNSSGSRAALQTTANLINGNKTLRFDGSNDHYIIANSGLINLAPYVVNKSYFMVIRTGPNVTNWQNIYKQGGTSRGLNIYIQGGSLYFHAWNNPNDGAESQWGAGAGPARYARFDGLQPNTNYIVSCIFDKDATQKLRIYVNGVLGQRAETAACGRIYTHSGSISLGNTDNNILYHDNSNSAGRFFNGFLAEMIHFSDAPINETRRRILENYFSGRYNIPLGSGQIVDLSTGFDKEIAGLGQIGTDAHTDSQGPSLLRIKSPGSISNGAFMFWGHNNVPLDEIWPWSNASLPTGVIERSGRVWRVTKSGTMNGFDVLLRYASIQNASQFGLNDLKLLVHNNSDGQDFNGAQVVNASQLMSGNVVKFTNVNLDDGSFFALGNTSIITPLPIELISFTAEAEKEKVRLNWITASELNNDYFVIERAGADLRWEPISTIDGAGNSNATIVYEDFDEYPLNGVSYYRLKQVDYDGAFEYADPVSVYFSGSNTDEIEFNLFPNPTNGDQITITRHGSGESLPLRLIISDMSGKIVNTETLDDSSTSYRIALPGNIAKGIYLVIMESDQWRKSYKLLIN